MSLPVEYDIADSIIVLSELPEKISITLQGRVSSLLTFHWSANNNPVNLSIRSNDDLSKDVVNEAFLKRLGRYNLILIRNQTSTIPLDLDNVITKQVPVYNHTEITPKKGFIIISNTISPSSIIVEGPSSFMMLIDSLGTSHTMIKNLDRNLTDSVHILKSMSQLIQLGQDKVQLEVLVSPLISKEITVSCFDLDIINPYYDSILVKLKAPEDLLPSPQSFNVSIDNQSPPKIELESRDKLVTILEVLPIRK